MNILQHHPSTVGSGIKQGFLGAGFLTLTHGNVDELAIGNGDVELCGATFHLGRGVHTREQHEEDGSIGGTLIISFLHVEGGWFDVLNAHISFNKYGQGREKTVGTHGS